MHMHHPDLMGGWNGGRGGGEGAELEKGGERNGLIILIIIGMHETLNIQLHIQKGKYTQNVRESTRRRRTRPGGRARTHAIQHQQQALCSQLTFELMKAKCERAASSQVKPPNVLVLCRTGKPTFTRRARAYFKTPRPPPDVVIQQGPVRHHFALCWSDHLSWPVLALSGIVSKASLYQVSVTNLPISFRKVVLDLEKRAERE